MSEQLELFGAGPFTVRLSIPEALRLFWDFYWQHLPSAKSSRQHFLRLSKFFEAHHLDSVSKVDVDTLRRELRYQGLADPTVNKGHMILSRMYEVLAVWKRIGNVKGIDFSKVTMPEENPARQVKRANEAAFARKKVCTPTDFQKLMRYAAQDMREDIQMLIWTRLHPGDYKKLAQTNVDWNTYQITGVQSKSVNRLKKPGGKLFTIPLTFEMERIIRRRIASRPVGAALFPMTNWQKRWKVLRAACDMLDLQTRDFRRTGASHLLDSGIDPLTVAEGLTHTSERMLKVYAPRTKRHLRESVRKLVNAYIADD